ncbi:hypothetical protein DFH28DRAFT_1129045 [Melampsora americana]|nr:hypothetical protein DFH28DRAFT_1129045 [Melampsora americana]
MSISNQQPNWTPLSVVNTGNLLSSNCQSSFQFGPHSGIKYAIMGPRGDFDASSQLTSSWSRCSGVNCPPELNQRCTGDHITSRPRDSTSQIACKISTAWGVTLFEKPFDDPSESNTVVCNTLWNAIAWTANSFNKTMDWQAPQGITNNWGAIELNGDPNAASAFQRLEHWSEPLPSSRNGTNAVREAPPLARYHADVLQEHRPDSPSGEEECLRQLLTNVGEETVGAGCSGEAGIVCLALSHQGSASSSLNKVVTTNSSGLPAHDNP